MFFKVTIVLNAFDTLECKNDKEYEAISKEKSMCKKLKELTGLSISKILETYHPKSNSYAVDMRSIMKNIGVPVSSFDFSELNQEIEHNILGAIVLLGDKLGFIFECRVQNAECGIGIQTLI